MLTGDKLRKMGFESPSMLEQKYDGSMLIFDLGYLFLSVGIMSGYDVLLMDNNGDYTGIKFSTEESLINFTKSIGFSLIN